MRLFTAPPPRPQPHGRERERERRAAGRRAGTKVDVGATASQALADRRDTTARGEESLSERGSTGVKVRWVAMVGQIGGDGDADGRPFTVGDRERDGDSVGSIGLEG